MRDNSISRALPRARAAAEQFERRYVQLAIACLPAGACCGGPSEKNVPGWPSRGLSGPKNGCLGTLIYLPQHAGSSRASASPTHRPIPCAGASACRALPCAGASACRALPCVGASACRALPRAWRSRVPASPAPTPPVPTPPAPAPVPGACKKGSCRVEIDPTTAQVAHSLGETCGRGAPRDIRRFGRARVGEPVCAGLDHAGSNPSPVAALRRPTPARGHDVAV